MDKKRGLILTNRHVVLPGPVVAEAIFQNREEVTVRATTSTRLARHTAPASRA